MPKPLDHCVVYNDFVYRGCDRGRALAGPALRAVRAGRRHRAAPCISVSTARYPSGLASLFLDVPQETPDAVARVAVRLGVSRRARLARAARCSTKRTASGSAG